MKDPKKGKSLFEMIFGTAPKLKDVQPKGGFMQSNYGNHVGTNHGTIMQVGNDTMGSKVSSTSFGSKRTLTINGKEFKGQKIEQRGGRFFVDGRDVTDEVGANVSAGQIVIVVQGEVKKLEAYGSQQITVEGNAGSISSKSGTITVQGDVTGSVDSVTGTITCGKVSGNVHTVNGTIQHS